MPETEGIARATEKKTVSLGLRVTPDVLRRFDAFVDKLSDKVGARQSRSQAFEALLREVNKNAVCQS